MSLNATKPTEIIAKILVGITLFFLGVFALFGFFAIIAAVGFLLSYPLMLLWNGCLVPAVSGVHTVSWLQMWGLVVLFGWLFKSSNSTTKNTEQKGK
jgi:hypothetical protein